MKKIPVLDTIRYAYNFTFGHLGTIIGLIWVPMVIMAIPGYLVMSHYYGSVPDALSVGNAAAVGRSGLLVMAWSVVSLLLSAIMYVAVTQQALGLREGPASFHFALGSPEFRVFGASMGFLAIIVLLLLIDLTIVSGVQTLVAKMPLGKGTGALVGFIGFLAIIYAAIRFSFLLVPATVAEEKIGLGRAWQLARGNFWRIAAVGIATLGPLMLIAVIVEVAILGPDMVLQGTPAPGGENAEQMQAMAEQMRAASAHLPLLYGLSFVMSPFLLGLALASAAFAYRALTTHDLLRPTV